MGRRSTLTDEKIEEICKWVSQGMSYKSAYSLSGISESCFYKWKKKGEERPNSKYGKFLQSLKKAEDSFKAWNVRVIMEAAKEKQWQAAAWLLERKFPEEFGRRDRHEITGANGEAIKISFYKDFDGV